LITTVVSNKNGHAAIVDAEGEGEVSHQEAETHVGHNLKIADLKFDESKIQEEEPS